MPSPDIRLALVQLGRFLAAGVLNTAVGLAVILALDLGLGAPPAIANAIGYAVGISFGWLLQRRFVFQADRADWGMRGRYLVVVAIAFAVNQAVLMAMHQVVGASREMHVVAQLCAVGTYSVTQFLLLKIWVFGARKPGASTTTPARTELPPQAP